MLYGACSPFQRGKMNEFAAGRSSLFVSNIASTATPMAMMKAVALTVTVFSNPAGIQTTVVTKPVIRTVTTSAGPLVSLELLLDLIHRRPSFLFDFRIEQGSGQLESGRASEGRQGAEHKSLLFRS